MGKPLKKKRVLERAQYRVIAERQNLPDKAAELLHTVATAAEVVEESAKHFTE